jgi:hypothetical protein
VFIHISLSLLPSFTQTLHMKTNHFFANRPSGQQAALAVTAMAAINIVRSAAAMIFWLSHLHPARLTILIHFIHPLSYKLKSSCH